MVHLLCSLPHLEKSCDAAVAFGHVTPLRITREPAKLEISDVGVTPELRLQTIQVFALVGEAIAGRRTPCWPAIVSWRRESSTRTS